MKISIKSMYTSRGVFFAVIFALFLCAGMVMSSFTSVVNAQEQSIARSVTQDALEESFTWEDYKDPSQSGSHRSLLGTIFDFIWKLIVVIGLLYLTVRFLKVIYSNKVALGPSGTSFNLLDTYYLKPSQAMYLVEILDRYFVMAGSSQSLNVVCEITDKDKIAQLKSGNNDNFSFKDNLVGMIGKKSLTLEDRISAGSQKILEQINKLSGR